MCGLLETRCEFFGWDISGRNCTLSNSCHRKSRGYWKAQYCVRACVHSTAASGSAAREGWGSSQPAGQPAGSPWLCRSLRRPWEADVHPQAVNGCGTWNLGGVFLKTDAELKEGGFFFISVTAALKGHRPRQNCACTQRRALRLRHVPLSRGTES